MQTIGIVFRTISAPDYHRNLGKECFTLPPGISGFYLFFLFLCLSGLIPLVSIYCFILYFCYFSLKINLVYSSSSVFIVSELLPSVLQIRTLGVTRAQHIR